jgi:hypothetical protein
MNTFKINTVIDSIDTIKQAEVPPFFETRLKAKMQQRFLKQNTAWFNVKKPIYIIATLIIFSSVNLYLISTNTSKNISNSFGKIQPSTIESFTNDYQLINNATY